MDFVEVMLARVGAEDVGHAGGETGSEERHQTRVAKSIVQGPLLHVLEFGFVGMFVVGRVHIVSPRFQAGLHNG